MTVVALTQAAPATNMAADRRPYWEVVCTPIVGADTLNEALEQTGLAWGLSSTELDDRVTAIVDGKLITAPMPGRRLILRTDTNIILGMVGAQYRMVENAEALSVAETLVEHGAQWTAAGEREHGRFVYMIVRPANGAITLTDQRGGRETIDVYVQIRAGHAGKGSVEYDMRAVRSINYVPVGASLRSSDIATVTGIDPKINVKHTRGASDRITEARHIMRSNFDFVRGFTYLAQRLIDTPLSAAQYTSLLHHVWSPPKPPAVPAGADEKTVQRLAKTFHARLDKFNEKVAGCFALWDAENFAPRTAYSAYCALSEYLECRVQARGKTPEVAAATRTLLDDNRALRSRIIALLLDPRAL